MSLPSTEILLSPWLLALLGLCIGSFLNVVIHRMPLMLDRGWWGDVADQLCDTNAHQRTFAAQPSPAMQEAGKCLALALHSLEHVSLAQPRSRCPSCGHMIAWHENLPVIGYLRLRGRCSACRARISLRYPFIELL